MADTRTALLLIDIQNGIYTTNDYYGQSLSNPSFETNVNSLLRLFRNWRDTQADDSKKPLIIHVQHHEPNEKSPLHPSATNKTNTDFTPFAKPEGAEPVFTKDVNSAFIGTQLESYLREHSVENLFICGLTTDHCVSTTTRMAANLHVTRGSWGDGKVVLISEATAVHEKGGFDAETMHQVHIASLRGEFCEVWIVEDAKRWVDGKVAGK